MAAAATPCARATRSLGGRDRGRHRPAGEADL